MARSYRVRMSALRSLLVAKRILTPTYSHNDPVSEKLVRPRHAAQHRSDEGEGSRRLFVAGYEALRRDPRLQRGRLQRVEHGGFADPAKSNRADRLPWQSPLRCRAWAQYRR